MPDLSSRLHVAEKGLAMCCMAGRARRRAMREEDAVSMMVVCEDTHCGARSAD